MEETTTEYIANVASTPDAWLIHSIHLFSSAEMIFEKSKNRYDLEIKMMSSAQRLDAKDNSIEDSFDYLRVGLLLSGYGFEMLLKYAYIKENKNSFHSTIIASNKLPKEFKTHNLEELAKLIQYEFHPRYIRFFNKLSVHIIWAGRYPTPTNSAEFDKSLYFLTWSQADIDDYYGAKDHLFTHLKLDYDRLKTLGVGLTSGSS